MEIPWSIFGMMGGVAWAIVAVIKSYHHYKIKKKETEYKMLELETERQKNKIRILEEENKKYDKIIESNQ
jgi:hypothetical protein